MTRRTTGTERVHTLRIAMPRRVVVLGLVLVCAIVAAGCSDAGHYSLTLARGTGDAAKVDLIDEVGLVRSVAAGTPQQPAPLPSPPAAWNPNGDLTTVTIYWQSNACSTHTTLTLTGNALDLAIEDSEATACGDRGLVPQFITLHIDRVIDVSAMAVHMVGQRPD